MNDRQSPTQRRPLLTVLTLVTAGAGHAGCGGTGGAWLWWLTDPQQKVEAEYQLGKGRLVILIDDEKGWLRDPAVRPLLTKALSKHLAEHNVNRRVVSHDQVMQLRQRDPKFDRRGAREIGQRLKADLVLHLNVRTFTLHDQTVEMAYKGRFVVAVKVLDVQATKAEDVRLWPWHRGGRDIEVTTDLHTSEESGHDEKLTRRLCEEMAEKIAQLFYDHTAPKPL